MQGLALGDCVRHIHEFYFSPRNNLGAFQFFERTPTSGKMKTQKASHASRFVCVRLGLRTASQKQSALHLRRKPLNVTPFGIQQPGIRRFCSMFPLTRVQLPPRHAIGFSQQLLGISFSQSAICTPPKKKERHNWLSNSS